MAGAWWDNPFTAGTLSPGEGNAPDPSFQLAQPTLGQSLYPNAPPEGTFSSGGFGGGNMGSLAGAGIGAAGSTISTLAQLMGAQAARNTAAEQNQLGRASTEAIAKMQIKAAAEMAAKQRQDDATKYLLGAMQNSTNAGFTARDTNRMANQGAGNLIAQAFMRR